MPAFRPRPATFAPFFVVAACIPSASAPPTIDPLASAGSAGTGGGASDEGAAGDGGTFAGDQCGLQTIAVTQDPANVYFVLDRSGSMATPSGGKTRYEAVQEATVALVASEGWRMNFGATLFPGDDNCAPGVRVVEPRRGDPKSFADAGKIGPETHALSVSLATTPRGGTPTATTLAFLVKELEAFGKNTYVVLATDGGPNCDDAIACPAAECTLNIDKNRVCDPQVNCCDPALGSNYSRTQCLDSGPTLSAVTALATAGVKTVVVGIPGSEPYADLLESLAVAGGAPRDASPRYYAANDTAGLSALFKTIGLDVLVSCDLTLGNAPPDPDKVNVYFDATLVGQGTTQGWEYTAATSIHINGTACTQLLSGAVDQVHVAYGCKTVVSKIH